MNNPASKARNDQLPWLTAMVIGLFATSLLVGCASQPTVTKTIYEDRSAWIRLEINPDADEAPASQEGMTPPASETIGALLKGFQAEKDYNPGVISFLASKSYYNKAFVEPELIVLTPQLAKGLAEASPKERVAYCLTADYTATERFITTGWVYLKGPYLHFKLVEWRTPIRVKSPATPTSEACLIKPIPGTKTVDRFFQLDYEPKNLIVTHGPLGASIYNNRGEVMLKLAGLASALSALPKEGNGQGTNSAQKVPNTSDASAQPIAAASAVKAENRTQPTKEVTPKQSRSKQKSSGGASAGQPAP